MSRFRLTALAVALLAVLPYLRAPANGFALDDEHIVLHNESVHGLAHLGDAVTRPYWPDVPGRMGMYRPLTSASFAAGWSLWGESPAGYHATNVALHVLVTLLLFLLLHELAGLAGAFVGAAVFAVHPVHVEAVANIVGRGELLAAVFFLLAALIYRRGEGRWRTALGVGVAYFLGLASKEIAVTLPGALLLLELVPRRDGAAPPFLQRVWRRWPVYAATVLALGGYLGLRTVVVNATLGNDLAPWLWGLPAGTRVLTAVATWPQYARLLLFPRDLVADYSPGVFFPATGLDVRVVLGLLLAALAGAVGWLTWRRERLIGLGIAWFALLILPVSNLFFPIGITLAERTLYLPSAGLALTLAGAARWAAAREPAARRALAAAFGIVLVLGAGRAWTRTPAWKDTPTVMLTLAREHPESFRVQWVVAGQLREAGRLAEALDRYRTAVDLLPGHYGARFAYGTALLDADRAAAAAAQFDTAAILVPDNPITFVYRMAALLRADRPREAIAVGERAVRAFPQYAGLHHQLALALARARRYDEAAGERQESLRLGADRANWAQWLDLAGIRLRLGQLAGARVALDSARSRAPASATVPSLDRLAHAVAAGDTTVLPYR